MFTQQIRKCKEKISGSCIHTPYSQSKITNFVEVGNTYYRGEVCNARVNLTLNQFLFVCNHIGTTANYICY